MVPERGAFMTTLRTSSAAARSRRGWILRAWRLWLSLVARVFRRYLGVGSSSCPLLTAGFALRGMACVDMLLPPRCIGNTETHDALTRQIPSSGPRVMAKVRSAVGRAVVTKVNSIVVNCWAFSHNSKHDNQIGQPCQVGNFWPENGLFMGVQ